VARQVSAENYVIIEIYRIEVRKKTMAKSTHRKGKRKRTTSEKLWIALALILAVSMVMSSIVALFQF
jgi:hypothetical protein